MELRSKTGIIQSINDFLYSPMYFFLVGILTVFSNIAGAEIFTYTCFVIIVLFVCAFGRDLLPIMPLAVCSYIAPSRNNNPGINDQSVFSVGGGGAYLIVLAVLLMTAFVYRLITDKELGGKAFFTCKRKLLTGMLFLGGAYLLGGLGSPQFTSLGGSNFLFAFIQFISVFGLYYILTATVKWDKAPKAYLAWTGVCVGYVLMAQLGFIYLTCDVLNDGVINRDAIFTGWGHYNNIGALLAIVMPFPFFLTGKGKYSGIFYLTGMFFLGGILFTCSRGSMVVGVVIYFASYIISLLNSRRARANLAIHIFTVLLVIVVFLLFTDDLLRMFRDLLDKSMDPGDRYNGYKAGIAQFVDYPIFGGSFYPIDFPLYSWSTSEAFVSFFPPRWHNTVLQMLASCGVVGLVAYLYHRLQTLVLFLRRPSGKKMFAFMSVAALLAASMVDCHIFNVGPTMFYSMLLAFVEKKLVDE